MVGPALGSLLIPYNSWLPWMVGETFSLLNIFTSFMLPNTKPELVAEESSTYIGSAETETGDGGAPPESGQRLGVKTSFTSILRFFKSVKQFIGQNRQVLLLLSIAFLGQLGSDSLLILILLYISKRYHWSFAKVRASFLLTEILQNYLTMFFTGRLSMVSGSRNTTCSATPNPTLGQSRLIDPLQTLGKSCRSLHCACQ